MSDGRVPDSAPTMRLAIALLNTAPPAAIVSMARMTSSVSAPLST